MINPNAYKSGDGDRFFKDMYKFFQSFQVQAGHEKFISPSFDMNFGSFDKKPKPKSKEDLACIDLTKSNITNKK